MPPTRCTASRLLQRAVTSLMPGRPTDTCCNDYLDQYARATRRGVLVPAAVWDALVERTATPADRTRLAQEAQRRGLYRRVVITSQNLNWPPGQVLDVLVLDPEVAVPGTVEETAEAVTAAGGQGIAAVCDHRDYEQARTLAGRIQSESGALHLLVNNAWGGYERLNAGAWEEWTAPFWDQPLELWDAMFASGVALTT